MTQPIDHNAETEPIPVAEDAVTTPAPEQVLAGPAIQPPAVTAPNAPAHTDTVSVPKRWLVWGGTAAVAFIVLAGTFALGVAVGHRAYGLDRPGRALVMSGSVGGQQFGMGAPGAPGGGMGRQQGGQLPQGQPGGQPPMMGGRGMRDGDSDGPMRGFGGDAERGHGLRGQMPTATPAPPQ